LREHGGTNVRKTSKKCGGLYYIFMTLVS